MIAAASAACCIVGKACGADTCRRKSGRRASGPAQFLARSNSSEACNKAFEGMHPSFKQVPPSTAAPTP